MPISAVDAISPAFEHARQQLVRPFRASQWAKLGLVGLLAGEMSSGGGGCNPGSFQMPTPPNNSQHFLAALPALDPMLYASLIAVLVVTGFVLLSLVPLREQRDALRSLRQRCGQGMPHLAQLEPAARPGAAFLCLADSAGSGVDCGFDHSGRNPGGLCFPCGLAQESQRAHDPAHSGRHGSVFRASAFRGRSAC